MDAQEVLSKLTLEEKASLVSGKDFWHTLNLERVGLPSMMMTDGPHGLRKQGVKGDHLGLSASLPATCFPTAAATACSFDDQLLEEIGMALGEECRKEDVAVLLGPAMNIKRNPLCGRNFEYFSEDPLLTGRLASAFVRGVQSRGVGASLKHFAANSQEKRRNWQNSVVDERALREIYLRAFERAAKASKPWTIMTAYNRLNGRYCSENKRLMKDIARQEWGFDGLFVTDWGAMSDPAVSFQNGLNLEMPGTCKGTDRELLEAIRQGRMTEEELDAAVIKVIELAGKYAEAKRTDCTCDMDAHLQLARRAAEESAVLLKNGGALPLKGKKLLVIGDMAKHPRYQGSGSSKVCPVSLDSFCEALDDAGIPFEYAQGYDRASKMPDDTLIREAAEKAARFDEVVLFVGLPEICESEGYDRDSMALPEAHDRLALAVCEANANTIVVLQCGSPVLLPWRDKANAILLSYLSGCQGGKAALRLLTGAVTPSGKLAETWPERYEDVPNAETFAVEDEHILYKESIYVGYRWYDTAQIAVAYPFGHGLSYTSFVYSDLRIEGRNISFAVKNAGTVAGEETPQLYIAKSDSRVYRPTRELKGYEKIRLHPGETRDIHMTLADEDLAVYVDGWKVENGIYTVMIGSSSRDIRLTGTLTVSEGAALPEIRYPAGQFTAAGFEKLYGKKLPEKTPLEPYTINTLLGQTSSSFVGRMVLRFSIPAAARKMGGNGQAKKMADTMMKDMPIRALGMGGGNRNALHGLVDLMNGLFFRGLGKIIGRNRGKGGTRHV